MKAKLKFAALELDTFVQRWLLKSLDAGEQAEWNQIILYDTRFREDFCEFIKSLRDPAWIKEGQHK